MWQRQPHLSHVFHDAHCLVGNIEHGGYGTQDIFGAQQKAVNNAAQVHQRKNSDLLGDSMGTHIAGQLFIMDGNTDAGDIIDHHKGNQRIK